MAADPSDPTDPTDPTDHLSPGLSEPARLPSAWTTWVEQRGRVIEDAGQWRSVRAFDAAGPEGFLAEPAPSGPVVSFASNDYLGLTQHPAVKAAAVEAIGRWGTGSGAARLVVGSRPVHHDLEDALAAWRGHEAALLFSTGFAANLSVLAAFGSPGVRILSDELNHASIIDGARMARADVDVYRHGDVEHLAERLDRARADGVARTVIATDTVFSMDGDVAPVADIVELGRRHGSLLVFDEAHAVLGPYPQIDGVDALCVGTLSKALGSLGGFVTGSRACIDLLINIARPFIFTTASTPADTAAALAALEVVRSSEGDELRSRLRSHIERLAPGHPSPIIPLVVGDERDAVALSAALLDRGLLVPAIRPPTVPAGTSRLRIALSAALEPGQVDALVVALADLHAVR
jgi:8-amino-7-oxononanoate synthase